MVVGFIIGILKLVLELMKNSLGAGILYDFATMNFLYFCIALFVFSVVLMIVVSLTSPAPDEAHLKGLTFATTVAEDKKASRASWNQKDVLLTVLVLVFIIAIFMYFSPLGIAK
jgi:SSS family solute:Na+ symporter